MGYELKISANTEHQIAACIDYIIETLKIVSILEVYGGFRKSTTYFRCPKNQPIPSAPPSSWNREGAINDNHQPYAS